MAAHWVLGQGGLLGSTLSTKLAQSGSQLYVAPTKFSWGELDVLKSQLLAATNAFSASLNGQQWTIYWAAGVGTMHSSESTMQSETEALKILVKCILDNPILTTVGGRFIFSSSAGAIYSGVESGLITDLTDPQSINFYGDYKLLQEKIVSQLTHSLESSKAFNVINVFIFRISTMYGTKQNINKKQGLLTEIARRALRGQPIHIFVPLDTMRDYVHVEDVAARIISVSADTSSDSKVTVEVIASGSSVTIAAILGMFKRALKLPLRIIVRKDQNAKNYKRVIRFNLQNKGALETPRHRTLESALTQILIAEQCNVMNPKKLSDDNA